MSKHAVEAIDKVQAQKNMIRMELKKSLDPVNNGFNPCSRPNPKLKRCEKAGEGTSGKKADGERRGSTEKNLRNGNWAHASVLLLSRDEPAGKKPTTGGRIHATTSNVLEEGGDREKKERVFC
jgi:hypothetical protein